MPDNPADETPDLSHITEQLRPLAVPIDSIFEDPANINTHDERSIRAITNEDRHWISDFISDRWGNGIVVAHGMTYHPADLPGLLAIRGQEIAGLLTYHVDGDSCEIVTIDALQAQQGIGTMLLNAIKEWAKETGCRRLWLITTNDNLDALRFYQRRGFTIAAVHVNAIEHSRKLKPSIPEIGLHGIPLRDEVEFEMFLQ